VLAADHYARAVASGPLRDECFEYACVLLLSDNREGYERYLQEMMQHAQNSNDDFAPFILTRSASIFAQQVVAPAHALSWAESIVDQSAPAWYLHAAALAELRAGRWQVAARRATESNAASWDDGAKAQNWLVLAMAYHGMGNDNDARQALVEAFKWLDEAGVTNSTTPPRLALPDFLGAELLRTEAEMLFANTTDPEK
jgi:tetratricopeptide (TPR) repeat protein